MAYNLGFAVTPMWAAIILHLGRLLNKLTVDAHRFRQDINKASVCGRQAKIGVNGAPLSF